MNSTMSDGSMEDQPQVYAPYGKACLNCVKSKTRCASSIVGGKCERCYRMHKDCQPAPTVRKKRVSKRPATSFSIKTAALEEKLEGIVQMLQRSHGSILVAGDLQSRGESNNPDLGTFDPRNTGMGEGSQTSLNDRNEQASIGFRDIFPGNIPSPMPSSTGSGRFGGLSQHVGQSSNSKSGRGEQIRYDSPPTPAASTGGSSSIHDRVDTTVDYPLETEAELEEYLETYRTKMVPFFPIVCISADTTVRELRKERPFLFLVIRAICSKNWERQAALILHVKKVLGNEMLLEGTKTLDLFLGILVFAAWCHVHVCVKPVNSTIIQLGISLAFELGLTRPLPDEPARILLNYTAQGCPKPSSGTNSERTMEERRAAVGLYLISSVFANFFQRIEFMRWTSYLDECLLFLEETQDYPTDILLVYLVRVQLICNQGSALTWNHFLGDTEMEVPKDLHVKTLKSQLENLERSIPQDLRSNETLQLHILNATLTVHEHSLSATSRPALSDPGAQLKRIESLWICLSACKSWFNIFFCRDSFPLSCYTHFSMSIITQMGHCFVALFRLSIFEAPEIPWDRQRVRQEIDLGDTVKLIVDNWEQVPRVAGIGSSPRLVNDRIYSQFLEGSWLYEMMKGLLLVKNSWEVKLAAMASADVGRDGGLDDNGMVNEFSIQGSQQMDVMEFGNMEMMDDTWIRDMLGGYDFNL